MKLAKIIKQCRVDRPAHFKLVDHDPAERFGLPTDIEDVRPILADGIAKLEDMQQRLYAQGQWAMLLVFQGMDAAGKDSVVKHVMSGINPQGCEVHGFKAPSAEEFAHDFLWRTGKDLPARGRIGIFNRSHYEEVLVVRVQMCIRDRTDDARIDAVRCLRRRSPAADRGYLPASGQGAPHHPDPRRIEL